MNADVQLERDEHDCRSRVRPFAERAFFRAAGAPLIEGNPRSLLKDARENYPAWQGAIRAAKHHIHFESYILSKRGRL
jgi:cardiolipin synthase